MVDANAQTVSHIGVFSNYKLGENRRKQKKNNNHAEVTFLCRQPLAHLFVCSARTREDLHTMENFTLFFSLCVCIPPQIELWLWPRLFCSRTEPIRKIKRTRECETDENRCGFFSLSVFNFFFVFPCVFYFLAFMTKNIKFV